MGPRPWRPGIFLAELRRRRVFRVAVAYGAVAFVVLQAADVVLPPLGFDQGVLRVLVILAFAGFPIALAFAWAFEVTAEGVRRTTPASPDSVASSAPDRLPLRRQVQVFGLFLVTAFIAAGALAFLVQGFQARPGPADRMMLAVFPFRPIGAAVEDWAEGAPDLLSMALDGTAGLRVADPWALWRPLRSEPNARPSAPDPQEAAVVAAAAGAFRFLLGSVVDTGDSVAVNLRLYRVDRPEPVHVFAVAGTSGDLAGTVRRAAVGLLTRILGENGSLYPPDLMLSGTASPEALKSYLAAREAMRRGMVDSAVVAIDRAIALDSTFVLALVEAVQLKSWASAVRGDRFAGLRELLDVAERHADSLNERTRLRLVASRASVETEGAAAEAAARAILAMDSTDIQAWAGLAYYRSVYGWQYGATAEDARQATERLVRLDSTYSPGLSMRAFQAVRAGDLADARRQLARVLQADTSSTLLRATLAGLRAVLATDAEFEPMLPDMAALDPRVAPTVLGYTRRVDNVRTRQILERLQHSPHPALARAAGYELARHDLAEGRPEGVDSLATATNDMVFRRLLVAGALAGVVPSGIADAAAAALAAQVPVDSAGHYFHARPVWLNGWLVGAHNATFGDGQLARRWQAFFDTIPPSGSPAQWAASLHADIEARLATRAGQQDEALDAARRAFGLWSIHTEATTEMDPEPSMRLHLGHLYRLHAMPDSAHALFESLVPPTAWLGFLTTRSDLELGEIALEEGDATRAAFHLERALQAWDRGGPAVATWRDVSRQRLQAERVTGRGRE
jgi:hypothetical protein